MRTTIYRTVFSLMIAGILCLGHTAPAQAGNWPCWRGPTGSGYTDEKDLPLKWDGKSGEGVVWKAALKNSTGHSCPIVWGDRVFITTADKLTRQQEEAKQIPDHYFACYQANDGKLLWQTRIPHGPFPEGYNIYAVPTPVTDGKAVYCWFGSSVIAAVDFEGKLLWRHERPCDFATKKNAFNPGICTSTVLYGDTVVLLCDQGRGDGFLQGLDKKTGQVKWEQKRPKCSYCNATPLLMDVKGKPQLIVLASQALQGLDPANGELIWSCAMRGFGASPVAASGLVLADKGDDAALLVDPTGEGDVTKTHVKWQAKKPGGDYCSAAISGGYVYQAGRPAVVICRRLSDGQEVYTERLDKLSFLASPIATSDGRVYFLSTGKSYVLKAGPKFEVIGGGDLRGWGNGSSPAVSNGRIFVRDFEFLWCLGK
jgi:outer membrane protein assembly factor BamB